MMFGAAGRFQRTRASGRAPAHYCRRLAARFNGWPHWVWPLGVGAVFAAVGLLVLEDYAVMVDTVHAQRPLPMQSIDFALGRNDALISRRIQLYGAAFELLPFGAEQLFDADDTRGIYLSRHLITHLFYIVGGFCGYLLAYRMTGSRLLGLFAMLLFLVHPRMYGHSFFNSKDVPFLSMLMIALLIVHWAFRKGTVMAFVVCGAAVAILTNLRIMGAMLLPAVLVMLLCDAYYAVGWGARRRVISSGAAFALAAGLIYYASLPYLWADPLGRFGELLAAMPNNPDVRVDLFRGEFIHSRDLPAQYLPVWIAVTTPLWALLLAGVGMVGICGSAVRRAGSVLRNPARRFELLVVGGAALPIIAVVVLGPNMYNGWRQMYFIWAPLCLLAALGLRQAGAGLAGLTHLAARMRYSGAGRYALLARVGLSALAALALAGAAVELIRLHPYQHLYFNRLVDRTTPEYLKTQYVMDYFYTARREGYRHILDHHPGATIQLEWRGTMARTWRFVETFSAAERQRFRFDPASDADYYMLGQGGESANPPGRPAPLPPPAIYNRMVYNSAVLSVATPDLSRVDPSVAESYREIYRATAGQEPALRAEFDFYRNGKTLTLVNEDCVPGILSGAYHLRVYPADRSDLPRYYRDRDFVDAPWYGVRFDGKCLMQATLPDYEIARIVVVGVGEILSDGYRAELRRQYDELRETEPVIQSEFAVYVGDGALRYVRDECSPGDTAAEFFLHLIPAALDDLPAARQEYGYGNRDFWWSNKSAKGEAIVFNDKCMATVELPDYELQGIRTGQFVTGEGRLWDGEFYTAAYRAERAAELAVPAEGTPAAQDFFSVWHSDGALTYVREDCAAGDTAAAFYLHLTPVAVADLPEGRREHGYDNRDFEFGAAGGVEYAGRCLVSVPLPDYAIARIHTGQYAPDAGRLWAVEIEVE